MKDTVDYRQTKYYKAIKEALLELQHATNTELLNYLKKSFPRLSATTVHRTTSRLHERGEIALAPPISDGSRRYDCNTTAHDHFMCNHCGILKDADVRDQIVPVIESVIEGCRVSGRLTIGGTCKKCISKGGV